PREVKSPLDSLLGLPGQADDEVAVNRDARLLAVLGERAGHFKRGAFLDVPQYLRIAGFKTHNKQAGARVRHGLERLIIAVAARRARPAETKGFELLREFEHAVFADVERIVVKEKFFGLREQFQRLADLFRDIIGGAHAPGVAGKRLRPQTKRAEGRAASRGIERYVGVEEKRNVVVLDLEVALVHGSGERQPVQVFRL